MTDSDPQPKPAPEPERIELAQGLFIPRLVTAPEAHALAYWCPEPDAMTAERVQAAVDERRRQLGVDCLPLLQLDWRDYIHPAYLDALEHLVRLRARGEIAHLGVANFDTDHLRLLLRHGVPIATNQVSFSLLDRRAAGRLRELCLSSGVRLLARGVLAGGLLSERWLTQPDPTDTPEWNTSKYRGFIEAIGGWAPYQGVLQAAQHIATQHGVTIAAVSLRWVLDQAAVGAVLVGARLGEREHHASNLAAFGFSLDAEDHALLQAALAHTHNPPGDCGDEYRKPSFLTASGGPGHSGESGQEAAPLKRPYAAHAVSDQAQRSHVDSGSRWEEVAGFSRAVRQGARVLVSGTTATHGSGVVVAKGDAEAQAVYIFDKISASLQALGARLEHVVRTRVYMRDIQAWEGPARVHGRMFADIRPANTLLAVVGMVGDYEIEIEAEAEVPPPQRGFISSGTPYEAMAGYSRAVVEGDWAFVSGTVGVNPATGEWAKTPRDQAHRAIDTIESALVRAGFALLDVVRVVVYLSSRDDVGAVSQVIRERFGPGRPTNTTLCATMALDECKVEIEVTAKRRVA